MASLSVLLCQCAGEAHFALGNFTLAEQFYLKSLSAKPGHPPAVIGYSNLLEREVLYVTLDWVYVCGCASFAPSLPIENYHRLPLDDAPHTA